MARSPPGAVPGHRRRQAEARLPSQGIVKLLTWCGAARIGRLLAIAARYKGYRYPIEVIGHAVWLARGHQMTDQRHRVQQLTIRPLNTLHEPILAGQGIFPMRRADCSAPS
jgi:hypothetical protein